MIGLLPNDEKLFSPLFIHKRMLDDEIKSRAFKEAIFKTVKPGDVVLDIGCGTGILTLWAIQAGAKKVYAIETEDIINVAKKIAEENGLSENIVWINDLSYNVTLPEKCNVLVTETIGNFGIDENIVDIILDAKKRLLTYDARIIPQSIDLFVCPVKHEKTYSSIIFKEKNTCSNDFSYEFLENLLINSVYADYFSNDCFLSLPKLLTTIAFDSVKVANFKCESDFLITKPGCCHGVCSWFVSNLGQGVSLGNPPQEKCTHWRQAFFPINSPIRISKGHQLKFELCSYAKERFVNLDWTFIAHLGDEKIESFHTTLRKNIN